MASAAAEATEAWVEVEAPQLAGPSTESSLLVSTQFHPESFTKVLIEKVALTLSG